MADRARALARPLSLAAGVSLLLMLAACGTDEPLTTISPRSDVAGDIQGLYSLIFWAAVFVFVVVEGLLVYAVIRYRRRPGDGIPPQSHGHRLLEIGWTLAPIAILVVVVIPTWQVIFKTADAPDGAMRVEVMAHQWWWEVRYPGLGVVTANEVHVPVGSPVTVQLETADVIHSFWVPRLSGKRDMVPGRVNAIWFTPEATGTFLGQCAELCGESHANMKFQVVVQEQAEFDAWVEAQRRAPDPPQGLAATGASLFLSKGCLACHTIEGTVALGVIGPNLTHVGGRSTLGAGMMNNTPDEMARWLRDPSAVKPGNIMTRDGAMYTNAALALTEDDIAALAAYLGGLR